MIGVFIFIATNGIKILKTEGDTLLEAKTAKDVIGQEEQDLKQAIKNIKEYSKYKDIAASLVPQDKDQANTISELSLMAEASGITLGSIDFPRSALGEATKKNAKTKVDPNTTQLTELTDLKGVYVLPITVTSHADVPVTYSQIINYIAQLESSRRTAQVTNISISRNSKAANMHNFTININTYVKP